MIGVLYYIFVFIFGLCIGSFLNCAIYRMESDKKLSGRSFCPKCKHTLGWLDLIPVFSFCFLGGKCHHCKQKISLQYPAVELATGLVFLLILNYQFPFFLGTSILGLADLVFWFYIASILIIIFVYDLKHYIIPDKILFPAIGISLVYMLVFDIFKFPDKFGGILIGFGFFFSIFFVSQGKWMGFGDVKFSILMGILLGAYKTITALFVAFFLGAIMGVIAIFFYKKKLKSEMPFGPFLILGTLIAEFWGEKIINWYLSLIA